MRTVQVSFHRDRTGRDPDQLLRAWPTLTDVAEAAVGAGVDVAVVQVADRDAYIERNEVAYHFVRDAHVPLPGVRWPLVVPARLSRRVRALAPDVIHVHGFVTPLATCWLRRTLPDTPTLVQDHGGLPPAGWKGVLAARCWRDLSAACFTAQEQARPYVSAGLLRADLPVFGVPESSTHFTAGDRDDAQSRMNVHGRPCIAWVGRLNENKDPLTVLHALKRAVRSLPDPQLWCCYGDAPLLDAVRQRIARTPALAGRVHLLGRLAHDRVEWLLRASDFLMLGSRREGSGYAVLEALACGVTPIVSDIPSFRRLTDGGRVGSVTTPGDAAGMARALCQWWAVPDAERRSLALEYFARELSFPAVGRQLQRMYEMIASGS